MFPKNVPELRFLAKREVEVVYGWVVFVALNLCILRALEQSSNTVGRESHLLLSKDHG